MYTCPFCAEKLKSYDILNFHVKMIHDSLQRACYCPEKNCNRSFSSVYAYKRHFDRFHSLDSTKKPNMKSPRPIDNSLNQQCNSIDMNLEVNSDSFDDRSSTCSVESGRSCSNLMIIDNRNENANLEENNESPMLSSIDENLLKYEKKLHDNTGTLITELYANSFLPRSNVQQILSCVNQFYQTSLEALKEEKNSVVTEDSIMNVKLEMIKNSFCNINTEYKALKYLENMGHLIKPISLTVNFELQPHRLKKRKTSISTPCQISIVPMSIILQKFLELKNVFYTIMEFMNNSGKDSIISSVLQGEVWQSIQSEFTGKIVLPLTIYYDDYEINNPLGTHRGLKKMSGVYYTISTIPPEFSSRVENLFLAQIHKANDHAKLGNKVILNNFVNELMKLREDGITINVDDKRQQVYFVVVKILGDNLGLNSILGFTKSFNANFFCRICAADKKTTQSLVIEEEKFLRSQKSYEEDIKKLQNGIIEECIFNSILNITEIRTVDPTHDILEGICRYEMGHILHQLIKVEKKFELEDLNSRMEYLDVDRSTGVNVPPPIKEIAIKKRHLILSAAEMAFFLLNFGILVGDFVDANNTFWKLYLMLRKIYCSIMAPRFTHSTTSKLQILIQEHHELYLKLIGPLVPKHHFLLHYPQAILKIGPLHSAATVRWESYHQEFKKAAQVSKSRVNACHTLAFKNQLQLACLFLKNQSLTSTISYGKREYCKVNALKNFNCFRKFLPANFPEGIDLISYIKYNNTLYKSGTIVCIKRDNNSSVFAKIDVILRNNEINYYVVNELQTDNFIEHIQAYEIEPCSIWHCLTDIRCVSHVTFPCYTLSNSQNVIPFVEI